MVTITEIEKLIAAGRLDDARDEIERLLVLEPQNSQAWLAGYIEGMSYGVMQSMPTIGPSLLIRRDLPQQP